jgi:hypothetical protein
VGEPLLILSFGRAFSFAGKARNTTQPWTLSSTHTLRTFISCSCKLNLHQHPEQGSIWDRMQVVWSNPRHSLPVTLLSWGIRAIHASSAVHASSCASFGPSPLLLCLHFASSCHSMEAVAQLVTWHDARRPCCNSPGDASQPNTRVAATQIYTQHALNTLTGWTIIPPTGARHGQAQKMRLSCTPQPMPREALALPRPSSTLSREGCAVAGAATSLTRPREHTDLPSSRARRSLPSASRMAS